MRRQSGWWVVVVVVWAAWPATAAETELVRNGGFEAGLTGWALSAGNSRLDEGAGSPAGLRVDCGSFDVQGPVQAFALQPLALPGRLNAGQFSLSFRFAAGQGANLGGFVVALADRGGNALVELLKRDVNTFGGWDWQRATATIDATGAERVNAKAAAGEPVLLLIALVGQHVSVTVDDLSLRASGEFALPALAGELAWLAGETTIVVADLARDEARLVWPPKDAVTGQIYHLHWRPDGQELGFSSTHEAAWSIFGADLWAVGPTGQGLRRITNRPARSELDGFRQTGSVSGVIRNTTREGVVALVYVDGAASPARVSIPPWSQTGFRVEQVADFGPAVLQRVVAIQGYQRWWADAPVDVKPGADSGGVQVTVGPYPASGTEVTGFAWSPDQSRLVFSVGGILQHVEAQPGLQAVGQAVLPEGSYAQEPAWSPDGRLIAYAQGVLETDRGIYLLDVAAGTRKLLLKPPASFDTGPYSPRWLPDGSGLLLSLATTEDGINSTARNIVAVDTAGQAAQLTWLYNEQALSPTISPDGRWLVYERRAAQASSGELWLASLQPPAWSWPLITAAAPRQPAWRPVR